MAIEGRREKKKKWRQRSWDKATRRVVEPEGGKSEGDCREVIGGMHGTGGSLLWVWFKKESQYRIPKRDLDSPLLLSFFFLWAILQNSIIACRSYWSTCRDLVLNSSVLLLLFLKPFTWFSRFADFSFGIGISKKGGKEAIRTSNFSASSLLSGSKGNRSLSKLDNALSSKKYFTYSLALRLRL